MLFVLVGSTSVSGQANSENASSRPYVWSSDPAVNQEAHQAGSEVRADWTASLATYNPYDQLTELEKFQLYNEWKVEAKEIVKNNPNARFKLHNSCSPIVKFYNTFAQKSACHPQDSELFIARLTKSLDGILGSSELNAEHQWQAASALGDTSPNVGGRRRLCGCPGCRGGYYCQTVCGCRRRRLQGGSDEIFLSENTPERMESLVASVIQELLWHCESRLHNIAKFTSNIDETCKEALLASKCEVVMNVWEAISLEVDGVDMLAADMIEEKLMHTQV